MRSPLESELLQGERILWEGRPVAKRRFSGNDAATLAFGLFWLTFTIGGAFASIVNREWAALAFMALFVGVGFLMVPGHWIWRSWKRRRTYYALTDRRVLAVLQGRRRRETRAAFLDGIPAIATDLRSDGSGTVTFGAAPANESDGYPLGTSSAVTFFDILDGRYVAELVDKLRTREPEDVYARA
jgi:hypothetical protein